MKISKQTSIEGSKIKGIIADQKINIQFSGEGHLPKGGFPSVRFSPSSLKKTIEELIAVYELSTKKTFFSNEQNEQIEDKTNDPTIDSIYYPKNGITLNHFLKDLKQLPKNDLLLCVYHDINEWVPLNTFSYNEKHDCYTLSYTPGLPAFQVKDLFRYEGPNRFLGSIYLESAFMKNDIYPIQQLDITSTKVIINRYKLEN